MIDTNPHSPKRLSTERLRELQKKYENPSGVTDGLILFAIETELLNRRALTVMSPAVR